MTELAPVRNRLINKGMVRSPGAADIAFAVPMFDEFLRRIMPQDCWWRPKLASRSGELIPR